MILEQVNSNYLFQILKLEKLINFLC